MLFPNEPDCKLTDEQIHAVNDARLALRLHKTIAEIEAMPAAHYQQLMAVIDADRFIDDLKDRRRGLRR